MANFALTGLAGYIAPRHLQAIKETGNQLVAALDPHDSVGVVDQYFPQASFFTEFERFDRHLERRRNTPKGIDYLSVCSPNHLHDAHIRLALRLGAHAICEKPLVLSPWNLDALQALEEDRGARVFTVLQLRVHPSLIELRERLMADTARRHKVRLTYITSRGTWYNYSWKGDIKKSGGVATNIGIHFFDMLHWFFGGVESSTVFVSEPERMGGRIVLKNADVEWYLSVRAQDLPPEVKGERPTHRSIQVDDHEVEFSGGFRDLHTILYERTIAGEGFGIEDARPSIELVHDIRAATPVKADADAHPSILADPGS